MVHSRRGAAPPFDLTRRFVRLMRVRDDGFVEFEFAIGEPALAVELILPAAAYRAFCRDNSVTVLPSLHDGDPGEPVTY